MYESCLTVQRLVGKKRDHVSTLQAIVPDVSKRAKAAFEEVGMDATQLPPVDRVAQLPLVERVSSAEELPTPLYVLYAQLCNFKAVSGSSISVRLSPFTLAACPAALVVTVLRAHCRLQPSRALQPPPKGPAGRCV